MTTGTWSAPGRVNLIGEHTDYNDGFALPFALPQRTRVRATITDETDSVTPGTSSPNGRWRVRTAGSADITFGLDTSPADPVTGWAAYVAGVVWAFREAGHHVPPLDVSVTSDVPIGVGLSSSAALECAVAVAINDLGAHALDRTTLATLTRRAENAYVGAPTGIMDQMASLHGQEDHVVLLDCRDTTVDLVPCTLAADGLSLLVIDTRAPHRHVDGEYGARRRSCEQAAAALGVATLRDVHGDPVETTLARLDHEVVRRRARHILTENSRVLATTDLLRSGRVADVGPVLTASHASMRDDFEITVAEVDLAVEAALAAGALGARMTGGGFGGSVIALVPEDAISQVTDAVAAAFSEHGFTAPAAFVTRPSAGASTPLVSG